MDWTTGDRQFRHTVAQGEYILHTVAQGEYTLPTIAQGEYILHTLAQGEYILPTIAQGEYILHTLAHGKYLLLDVANCTLFALWGTCPIALPFLGHKHATLTHCGELPTNTFHWRKQWLLGSVYVRFPLLHTYLWFPVQ